MCPFDGGGCNQKLPDWLDFRPASQKGTDTYYCQPSQNPMNAEILGLRKLPTQISSYIDIV